MSTETKLRKALDKLDRRLTKKTHGRPMSGLSIPADYYLGRKARGKASVARAKKQDRSVAAK